MSLAEDRHGSLIKVALPRVGVLLEQRKRALRVVKTIHLTREGKGNKRLFFRRYMKWKSEADDQGFPQVQDHNSERESGCDVLETDLHLLTYECLIY